MNIVIEHEDSSLLIVLPLSSASAAAELLANARTFKVHGYPTRTEPTAAGLSLRFDDGKRFEPESPETRKALEAKEAADTARWQEYSARQKAEKELAEVKAALEALKSVTVCQTVTPPEQEAPDPTPAECAECDSDTPF